LKEEYYNVPSSLWRLSCCARCVFDKLPLKLKNLSRKK
jgi:hypothetical protein